MVVVKPPVNFALTLIHRRIRIEGDSFRIVAKRFDGKADKRGGICSTVYLVNSTGVEQSVLYFINVLIDIILNCILHIVVIYVYIFNVSILHIIVILTVFYV